VAKKKQKKLTKAALKKKIINLVRRHGKVKLISRERHYTFGDLDNYRARVMGLLPYVAH
jgi:hypothetical protein